jgi:dolichol-phosphate mannosyltransferase
MSWTGFTQVGVPTARSKRHAGRTKYNLTKSIKLATEIITSFSNSPLRLAAYLGFFFTALSSIAGITMLVSHFGFGNQIIGSIAIIVSAFFIGGVQLLIIGILGEYIGRIFTEVQKRPLYLIKQKLGIDQINVE